MKTINELIDELIQIQSKYGDIEVVTNGFYIDYIDIKIDGSGYCGYDDFGPTQTHYCDIISK